MTEKAFEQLFALTANRSGCLWIKIPDAIKTSDSLIVKRTGKITMREHKRPADGILITPNGCLLIELKSQYGQPKDHQVTCCDRVNAITHGYLFIRCQERKKGMVFSVELPIKGKLFPVVRTDEIKDIFAYCNNLLDRKSGSGNV